MVNAQNSADTVTNPETGAAEVRPQAVAPPPVLTEAAARAKAERLMVFRDFAQKYGLSYFADGNTDRAEEFALNKSEFDMLVDVYKDYMGSIGEIPWLLKILTVEGLVMGPKIKMLLDFRKVRKENEGLKEELRKSQNKVIALAANTRATREGKRLRRRDTKTFWTVDSKGRFVYDTRSKYLKAGERMERPEYNLDSDLLKKHNKADLLKQAFNL